MRADEGFCSVNRGRRRHRCWNLDALKRFGTVGAADGRVAGNVPQWLERVERKKGEERRKAPR